MGYFGDCFKYFGIANFSVRWMELVSSVLGITLGIPGYWHQVLVLGGVLALEKIGDTADLSLAETYNGIYNTAWATRFTVFAVPIPPHCLCLIKGCVRMCNDRMDHHFCLLQIPPPRMAWLDHYDLWYPQLDLLPCLVWLSLVLSDMYRWASIAAALSSTYNALEFCKHMGTILDNYRSNTARPLDSVVSYIQGLQLACKYTYVGLSFGIVAW